MSELSREILERVERVFEFHEATGLADDAARGVSPPLDEANRPNSYRVFADRPLIPLPTHLLDAPVPTIALLSDGLTALPESQVGPPHDLRTLATWLYMAAGRTVERRIGEKRATLRASPSAGALYPCEIYVAAFNLRDLPPGLYHFSVKEFALRTLREGSQTLAAIKRGRPDLEFLKSVPAALLVSTIFWRSAWKYRQRGYRMALLDAGHVVQNLVAAGNGLGIQTMPRLRVHEASMREVLGLGVDAAFGAAESVQSMVVWADDAASMPSSPPASAGDRAAPAIGPLDIIERAPLSPAYLTYGSIAAVHEDCVAPGMAVRMIRPPTTGTCAMPPDEPGREMPLPNAVIGEPPLRHVMSTRRSATSFDRRLALSRSPLLSINRTAFLGGSFHPVLPDGPYVGLVRPFWVIHDVSGIDSGVWYYHPPADRWWLMRRGSYRLESSYLCAEQALAGDAAALCWICADLTTLCSEAGPDAYRLAHLEAGIVAERIHLAAAALAIGCCGIGSFYDAETRGFLATADGKWEPLYAVAMGIPSGKDANR